MLEPTLQTRFERLFAVQIAERKKQFPFEVAQIDSNAIARGMLHSGNRNLLQHKAHERELQIRAILAWESLVRVHRIFGSPASETLRDDFKTELHRQIEGISTELSYAFDSIVRTNGVPNPSLSLDDAYRDVIAKHDIEIDLYVDSLSISNTTQRQSSLNQNYNFYGSVGSVQTGPNSIANVVQNLGAEDRTALSNALQQVREVLSGAPNLEERQRRELVEIAEQCESQLAADAPNNTRLLAMFNVLGTAIQSIASAQPAYQALKLAILPLGITLP